MLFHLQGQGRLLVMRVVLELFRSLQEQPEAQVLCHLEELGQRRLLATRVLLERYHFLVVLRRHLLVVQVPCHLEELEGYPWEEQARLHCDIKLVLFDIET